MTTIETALTDTVRDFVETVTRDAAKAFRVLRETGTVTGNGTVNFVERVPGAEIAVALNEPGPWADDRTVHPVVATFDGEVLSGKGSAGFVTGYAKVFRAHPEITSVVHVHSPWLGGWAQTHRTFPIRYAAVQRLTLSRAIPPHIDRSIGAGDFILERLAEDPDLIAIFEANGGANVIGRKGLLDLAQLVVLLEEGAQYQAIAETLGGSVDFDKSNLAVQWSRTGLADEARRRGLL
ncbi:class II aldolase/adducin family protein [Nocardia yamanashiensis]|uniref:class II aldolase/adducin family protein n=1 Tax=Nocardia yamanashiensis TaxID=209247 RepID=UPI001E3106CB|nr:class II aldolase/adducin family protein [Nocardia yamanashiensis]UGT43661.1 class II aldolase/adducin family protein [Nocardia yamanashiensis]